jgi:predicted transposase YbfD/YdcC
MGLYKEIEKKNEEEKALSTSYWKQQGHGHPVKCKIRVWKVEEKMRKKWKGLTQFIAVTRTGYRDKKRFKKTTFYITNTDLSCYRLSNIIRGHRKIENTLHWVKDVIMKEDECGIHKNKPAGTLGILRNIAFNLLKMTGEKSIKEGMEKMLYKLEQIWEIINLPVCFFKPLSST